MPPSVSGPLNYENREIPRPFSLGAMLSSRMSEAKQGRLSPIVPHTFSAAPSRTFTSRFSATALGPRTVPNSTSLKRISSSRWQSSSLPRQRYSSSSPKKPYPVAAESSPKPKLQDKISEAPKKYRAQEEDLLRRFREWKLGQERRKVPQRKPYVEPLSDDKKKQLSIWQQGPGGEILGTFTRIELSKDDLRTLKPRSWLNDNVIDAYLADISAEFPSTFAFTTHFFTQLEEKGYNGVKRWARRKQVDVFAKDMVFIPVNQGNMHWTLAIVDNKEKCLKFYDSMGGRGRRFLDELEQYLVSEAKSHGKVCPKYSKQDSIEGPRQKNGSDCGVFVCQAVKCLATCQNFDFNQNDMPLIRDQMAYRLGELVSSGK